MGRIKERARILRQWLRRRPWPLALAMLALGITALVLAAGEWRPATAAPPRPAGEMDQVKVCRTAPPDVGRQALAGSSSSLSWTD